MLDSTQASGLFVATVLGSAIGIVAGTLIQYFLTLILQRKSESRQKIALIKELTYNRSLVDEIAAEIVKFRNAVNGNIFNLYFGYLSCGKGLFVQANAAVTSGLLYKLLSKEEIRHVQRIIGYLSPDNEKWVNSEITRRRNIFLNTPQQFDQQELVSFVNFVESQVSDLKIWIDILIMKLDH